MRWWGWLIFWVLLVAVLTGVLYGWWDWTHTCTDPDGCLIP